MRASTLRRYGFAALITAIAIVLRQGMAPILGPGVTFLLAFPAVMVSAWYGGLGPGALSTALSSSGILFVFYLRGGPLGVFELTRFIIFALSGALISVLCESLRRTTERAEAEAAERGRAEASLRESRDRLGTSERMFAESQRLAHVGSWELELDNLDDLNANPLRWSDEACRIFGYTPGEVEVTNALFFEAVHPDDRAAVAAAVAEALRERRMYQIEHRIRRPDGAERFVYEWGTILTDPSGRPRRILGTCQDVTDRKRAELALHNREDLLRLITDVAPALISYIDERTRRYPQLTGFFSNGPIGSSASLPLLIGERLLGVLGLAWTGRSAFGEDDQQFILALARQCAQALERARLYEAEQRARAEAEASNKAKDQFLAVLSHELRTPLTAVLAAAQLLERGGSQRRAVGEMAALIRRNAELEARLIDDLLDLTRVSRGKLSLTFEAVDAHAKVHDVLRACASELDTKEIQVVTELEARQHHVEADQARFQQVIWNLVKNAAKFSKQGGKVTLRTRNDSPDMLTLEVTDEGIGIEQELLPRLFNAFEQGRREVTRHFGGLGLGLAVSKALVDAQGGSISASSPGVNRGATFTVKVPLARARADAGEGLDEMTPSLGRARILLVEDHEDTAELMAELLRGKGYTVRVAGTVAEAVRIAEAEPLDLLLSDLGLPDGTGFELMRQLQGRRPLRGIALSGFGMERDIQEAKAAGFVEHLTKPVNTVKLFKVISQVLEQP